MQATFRPRAARSDRALFRRLSTANLDDDTLEEVALTYRLAHAAGERPTKAVMERLGVSRSSANCRIAKAREKGLLGSAIKRKACEKRVRRRKGK